MTTDIIPLKEFIEALKEEAEESEEDLYVLKGDKVSSYSIRVNDDKGCLQIGSDGWAQKTFKEGDDVSTLQDLSTILDATLLVPKDKLSGSAIELTKQQKLGDGL